MAFNAAGNNITQRISFNSGTLDFGSNRLVQLDSVNIEIKWSVADIYTLGSIKRQDIARHSEVVTLGGKIKSYAPELEMLAMGSSTAATPNEIDALDGQPTLQNPVMTLFDRNGKQIQYQLQSALFTSTKISASNEAYTEWEFSLEAKDLIQLYTT